jgi:S-adenosylmethionine hydrolase
VTRRRGEKGADRRITMSLRPRVSPSPRPPVPSRPLITLLTDFGSADYFVGAMKGVILSTNHDAHIVDVSHEIPAHDVASAAFTLLATYKSFPKRTVHVAVVDPGVGSERRGIVVQAGGQFFVGPDNGIFSYIYERESPFVVFELSKRKYFHNPVSQTFHGRDIFAPVAAALANGIKPTTLGKKIRDPVRLAPLAPEKRAADAGFAGRIIHVDRFGNCVTNITRAELTKSLIDNGASLSIKGKRINSFRDFFAETTTNRSKLFCIWGSAGFLEIAAANSSAAKLLKAKVGTDVFLKVER